jgi:hypothetical protein
VRVGKWAKYYNKHRSHEAIDNVTPSDKFFALTLLCTCLIAGSVFAQRQTGRITGTVLDADGNPLPGVTVEISSPSLL